MNKIKKSVMTSPSKNTTNLFHLAPYYLNTNLWDIDFKADILALKIPILFITLLTFT